MVLCRAREPLGDAKNIPGTVSRHLLGGYRFSSHGQSARRSTEGEPKNLGEVTVRGAAGPDTNGVSARIRSIQELRLSRRPLGRHWPQVRLYSKVAANTTSLEMPANPTVGGSSRRYSQVKKAKSSSGAEGLLMRVRVM